MRAYLHKEGIHIQGRAEKFVRGGQVGEIKGGGDMKTNCFFVNSSTKNPNRGGGAKNRLPPPTPALYAYVCRGTYLITKLCLTQILDMEPFTKA